MIYAQDIVLAVVLLRVMHVFKSNVVGLIRDLRGSFVCVKWFLFIEVVGMKFIDTLGYVEIC